VPKLRKQKQRPDPRGGVGSGNAECGGPYTGQRSLRMGSCPWPVAFGPDDVRESSAPSSPRNHPWVRAMIVRRLAELVPNAAPLRLFFCPVGALSAPVGGGRSQQMSCQRLRVERRACVPPVSSQMERRRRQSRVQ